MESVFCKSTNPTEDGVLLYTLENQIIFQKIPCHGAEEITTPYLLETDFLGNLCICQNRQKIWYAYQTIRNTVVIKSLQDKQTIFELESSDALIYPFFQLCILKDKLMLIYCIKDNVKGICQLCMQTEPFKQMKIIHDSIFPISNFSILPTGDGIIVCIGQEKESVMAYIDESENICHYPTLSDFNALKDQLNKLQEQLQHASNEQSNLRHEQENQIQTIRKDNENQIQIITKNKEMQICKQKEEYEALLAQKDLEVKKLNILLERAKAQYNTLADTAIKYRNEAIKWHNLCDF